MLDFDCVANWDSGFDDYGWVFDQAGLVGFEDFFDDIFDAGGVKVVLGFIVISWSSNDDVIGIFESLLVTGGRGEIEVFRCEELFDFFVFNWGFFAIDKFDFFWNDFEKFDSVVLCKKGGETKAYIACASNGDIHNYYWSFLGLRLIFLIKYIITYIMENINTFNGKTILITGAAGFIGWALTKRVCAENPEMRATGLYDILETRRYYSVDHFDICFIFVYLWR